MRGFPLRVERADGGGIPSLRTGCCSLSCTAPGPPGAQCTVDRGRGNGAEGFGERRVGPPATDPSTAAHRDVGLALFRGGGGLQVAFCCRAAAYLSVSYLQAACDGLAVPECPGG